MFKTDSDKAGVKSGFDDEINWCFCAIFINK